LLPVIEDFISEQRRSLRAGRDGGIMNTCLKRWGGGQGQAARDAVDALAPLLDTLAGIDWDDLEPETLSRLVVGCHSTATGWRACAISRSGRMTGRWPGSVTGRRYRSHW
jgi:hypothetical protein